MSDQTGMVVSVQLGVFRTNCMDCLDRTNVVQSMLAHKSVQEQLRVSVFQGVFNVCIVIDVTSIIQVKLLFRICTYCHIYSKYLVTCWHNKYKPVLAERCYVKCCLFSAKSTNSSCSPMQN